MIVKGLTAVSKALHQIHVDNRKAYYQRLGSPSGANVVGGHDEDYVVDALFDIPNR